MVNVYRKYIGGIHGSDRFAILWINKQRVRHYLFIVRPFFFCLFFPNKFEQLIEFSNIARRVR